MRIKKILIANRSEIACRIIKTCKSLGIETVAVYSEADENALHRHLADESVFIGESKPSESYLNHEKIISAAKDTNCDAIHPGYGFLSENPEFNKKVRDAGLTYIGPNAESMDLLGSKTASRKTMIEAGVPVAPGMKSGSRNTADFLDEAKKIGFPVLVKAAAGGGGKGMRIVREEKDLVSSVEAAMREAKSAFGDDEIFVEKYIESPRHIEFQIACDHHGNAVHLFERECSIQRRHQKIIEETPSVALDNDLRVKMGQDAIKAVQAAGYDNIGTVEFLLDSTGNYYFLEVNARIQVEHPITEETTGIDLVKLQIDIAEGKELSFKQDELVQTGHAIECRIYAEDAEANFMPDSGKILYLKEPSGPGVRYDSGIKQNGEISVFYDPVMAKLIVKGNDREEARTRMISALKDNIILGVKTSIPFMINCLKHRDFIDGNTYTNFIDKNIDDLLSKNDDSNVKKAIAVASIFENDRNINEATLEKNPWKLIGNWEICSGV